MLYKKVGRIVTQVTIYISLRAETNNSNREAEVKHLHSVIASRQIF